MFRRYLEMWKETSHYKALLRADMLAREKLSVLERSSYGTAYDHAIRVANIAIYEFGLDKPELIKTAILHDILEDSSVSPEDLTELFSLYVSDNIRCLSRNKISVTQEVSDDKTLLRILENFTLASRSQRVRTIKCADRVDNLRDMLQIPPTNKKYERIPGWIVETKLSILPLIVDLPNHIQEIIQNEVSNVESHFANDCKKLFDVYSARLKETVDSINSTAINMSTSPIILTDIVS